MTDLPLLRRPALHAPFARRRGETITAQRFLQDVSALAAVLPDRAQVANLCQDRYRFVVGFAAALTRRQLTLLPPSEAPGQLAAVLSADQDVYCLTDGEHAVPVPEFRFPRDLPSLPPGAVPMIPESQPAAVLYTSGSTGRPMPHPRSWGLLVSSAIAAGLALGAGTLPGAALIGTVPHQHSYGLESLVMLALQHGLVLHAERPFYPHDIRAQLDAAPRPRILVTTPVHLRVLLAEAASLPSCDIVLSATAPLPPATARAAEAAFAAPLHEIYGCSEAGQLAHRRPTRSDEWHCLDGIALRQDDEGTHAQAPGIADTLLGDAITLITPQDFRLHGRLADSVNIAGKRSSLAFLNAHLTAIDGVMDGAFVMEPGEDGRLIAFVVTAPDLSATTILHALRARVDPAFLPRRVHLRATLPRNTLGKLTQEAVAMMIADSTPG